MIALNACDPANPFGSLFPATTQGGEEIKFLRVPQKYLVLQAGRPLLLYEGRIKLLVDRLGSWTSKSFGLEYLDSENEKQILSRGRNAGYPAPPAQIPACTTNALGSYLRCITQRR